MEHATGRPPRGAARRTMSHAGRFVGYLLGPGLSALSPILVLPTVAPAAGDSGWAAIAIGQSIGSFALVVIAYGWTINGPVKAARATPAELAVLYHESLVARGTILAPAALLAATAAWLAAPTGWGPFAAVTSLAFAAGGLSSAWLCIGLGRPLLIVAFETAPRLAFALLAALAISLGGSVWWYPVLLLAGTVLGILSFSVWAVRPQRPPAEQRRSARTVLASQNAPALTTVVGASYAVGGIFLASLMTSAGEIADLSSADRIYRLATVGVTIAASLLTPWVAVRDHTTARRTRLALVAMTSVGVVGMPVIAFLTPVAARILFGADLEPSAATSVAYGVAFAGIAVSTGLGQHYLVPRGREVDYMTGSVVAALLGAPSILVLASRFGADGAAAGLAVSEVAIVVVLAVQALRLHRRGAQAAPLSR